MSVAQNEKIRQVTDTTMVIGVDIASELHWARAFDWRGLELSKAVKFENSAEGFHYFLCWASELAAEQKKGRIMVGLEPTGHYWFTLAAYLQGGSMKMVLVNPCEAQQRTRRWTSQQERQEGSKDNRKVGAGRALCTPIHPIRAVCGTESRHELPLESTERAHFSAESNPALAKNLLSRAQNCVWGI